VGTHHQPPLWTWVGRWLLVLLLAAVASLAGVALPGPASAAPACADPGKLMEFVPWPQDLLSPRQVWPATRGGGVTVAVLDSGVDAGQPQLRGHVAAGFDAVAGHGPADDDCLGTGTQVAGVIAAQDNSETPFVGIAPGVVILPIRVIADPGSGPVEADPHVLARGIDAAVEGGANVIVVSTITYTLTDDLAAAVADAVAAGVVVVAAVGDLGDVSDANPDPYPAAFRNVIGVGAIGQSGQRWAKSQHGSYVDLVAPGDQVVSLQPGHGAAIVSGTGVAAGFVGATVALVRGKRGGGLGPQQIEAYLEGTTTPAPGGPGYGHGIVNPLAAVNDELVRATPATLPALSGSSTDVDSGLARSRNLAIGGAVVAMVAVFLIVLGAITMPRGRRRFWHSVMAPTMRGSDEPMEPGPPLPLFEDRPPA
jgi:membrane-anchored mycosin MYCP